jgi:two-component system, OmpR family, sensor histidine kinase KdpD
MNDEKRPDPDALLERLRAEEARESSAKLKIFFGFAPGVGKTYRMLQVARELEGQGVDVVIGVVETHRRKETAALLEGQEVLPRRQVEYRGHLLEEFDLQAALARKPRLILMDELAHTNAEGSWHGKRWQDVIDLLEAGIDVFTTVNVQHIESLNDVVAQITRVQVRETVPDTLLERADEIELVDISPEQLLQRLKEGKVYLPDQAVRAATHFFQRGNLLALRELALRRTAEHVESDVQEYRAEFGVERTWATTERVLVSVGPSPASARLVRAAKRMAVGLRAPWVAVYVEGAGRPPLRDADLVRLDANLRLAESLGATVVRLSGNDVAGPLLAYARKHNVTRLIIGKPTHSRVLDRLRGSLLDDVVRGSGDIDVHVISGDVAPETDQRAASGLAQRPSSLPYVWALLVVAITTGLGLLLRALYPIPDLEMLYLLAVMVVASRFGRGPSMAAAALSVAAYDFFFVPPHLTFAVRDARYFLTFTMMFLVSSLLSALTTRLKRQEQDALAREERASALYVLSRQLGALLDPSRAASVVAAHASDSFDANAAVLATDASGTLEVIGRCPPEMEIAGTELGVAKWVYEHGRMAGLGTDTLPGAKVVCSELRVGPQPLGVVALSPRSGLPLGMEQSSFFEAFCRQAAFAFERARLADQARLSALRAKTEELRSSLLSAVSHDLRTPLASITGAASSLREDTGLSAETRGELLDTIGEEAERLERLVANLLDMTRLETGGLSPRREWVPLEELVGAALTRLEPKLQARKVETRLDSELPLLSVDPVLMQQVFVNLLENALKYTPEGTPIDISAKTLGAEAEIAIRDYGPGIEPGQEERIFEKFQRGDHVGIGGVGLGLPICRGIAEAHGGTLRAVNAPDGGARFELRLPLLPGAPPAELENAP